MHQHSQYQPDAVHFAIALAYYGLLRIPSKAKTPDVELRTPHFAFHSYPKTALTPLPLPVILIKDGAGDDIAHLNFARLLHRYTRAFVQSDVQEALQYLYLICLNADLPSPTSTEQITLCHDYIRELVMETRKYAELLGDVRNDGTKIVRRYYIPPPQLGG